MRKNLTPDEVRKRLSLARNHINLGSGPLLSPSLNGQSDEEAEKSLERLLAQSQMRADTSASSVSMAIVDERPETGVVTPKVLE